MEYLIIFVLKVIDNILATGKTILIQKNKAFIAALSVILSQVIFYKLIAEVVSSENDIKMLIVALGGGIGTYLVIKFNDKFSKEQTYVNVILSDNKDAMIDFREYLAEHRISNLTTDGYTKEWEKTLAITVYAETKEHSKLVDAYIKESDEKFKRVIYNK